MSHNYFFDTYNYIAESLAQARQQLDAPNMDPATRSYTLGRLEALRQFQQFLTYNFESKLPRRLARLRTGQDDSSCTG